MTKAFERLSHEALTEINERRLGAERGPYLIVTDPEKLGENWFVAHLGTGTDMKERWLTTDHVHASECCSTAESQAKFFAHAERDVTRLLFNLVAAYEEIDRLSGLRLWQRWCEPRRKSLRVKWAALRERLHKAFNFFGPDGKARWWLAEYLNRRGDTCWSALVHWAYFGDSFWDYRDEIGGAGSCKEEGKTGSCYCGKFMSPEVEAEMRAEMERMQQEETEAAKAGDQMPEVVQGE